MPAGQIVKLRVKSRAFIVASDWNRDRNSVMQVSQTQELEDGRQTRAIGRIKAVGAWRAASAVGGEAEKRAALRALVREAEDCGADAIVGVEFHMDGVMGADIEGVALKRVVATGVAVRFALAA
jgi:uncharacterized protein YbjQ (UPF0145 family)